MSTADPRTVAAAYFDAWRAGDLAALRGLLADEVTYTGPLGRYTDADACCAALAGTARLTTALVVDTVLAAAPDVLTWFSLHTTIAPPTTVAT